MKAVIFDMDGVLVDSEPIHDRLKREKFDSIGIRLSGEELESFVGMTIFEMFSRLKERFGFTQSIPELVDELRRGYMNEVRRSGVPLIPDIPELVQELSGAGIAVAVASSAPHEQINIVMEAGNLGRFIKVRVSGDDVEKGKPDPAVFLEAAEQLGVAPSECWVIEDSENGLAAARSAGMKCLGYINPSSGSQNLERADRCIESIKSARNILLGEL